MIRYYCDSCDKQVSDEPDLYECNIPSKTTYGSISKTWHICEHCLDIINKLLANNSRWKIKENHND